MYEIFVFTLLTVGISSLFIFKNKHRIIKSGYKIEKEIKRSSTGKMSRFKSASREVLKSTRITYAQFLQMTIISSIAGFFTGLLFSNILLSLVLSICMAFVPLTWLRLKKVAYMQMLNDQLEGVLSLVTNAYLQSGDLIKSVEESLPSIEPPFYDVFREFIGERVFIDTNVARGIKKMQGKIDNPFWYEWCDIVILCQEDSELRYTLPPIVEKIADTKEIKAELQTIMYKIYKQHAFVCILAIGSIPMLNIINGEWYSILAHTIVGNILVTLIFLAVFITTAWVIRINKPINVE